MYFEVKNSKTVMMTMLRFLHLTPRILESTFDMLVIAYEHLRKKQNGEL